MTEMNEQTSYTAFDAATEVAGTAGWPRPPLMTPSAPSPGDHVSDDDHRDMNRYGISHHHKSVYSYKTHVYERLADALAYARIDHTAGRDA